jgi:hypothetical protein
MRPRRRARVLEEERPLLRKEQVEAVEVDLLLVDLDLREVGVDGGVERRLGVRLYLASSPTSPSAAVLDV